VARSDGDADAALAKAATVIETEFTFPYLAHAPMEPLNAVVRFDGKEAEFWSGSQLQTVDQLVAGQVLGIAPEKVKIKVAAADFDRRDLHRWKSLLEAAYANNIRPKKFKKELVGLHGVSGALAHWTNNTPKRSKPRSKHFFYSPSFSPAPAAGRLHN
jgi:CO/xanthine dehydrogenase Mo-binding subunit